MKCSVCGKEIDNALVCRDCAKEISKDVNKTDWETLLIYICIIVLILMGVAKCGREILP
jgi:predicted nucleic acid-binding Zn ribbon protein